MSSALSPALLVSALFFASPASAATKLIDAVKQGDAAAVRALIAQKAPGNNVNASDPDGSTALHWAVQRDDVALIDMLLAAGADVKAATRYKITPLSLACTNGNARVVDRLLKAGADPNAVSEEGQTALMTASLTGKPDAVKLLLEAGANAQRGRALQGADRADVGGFRRQCVGRRYPDRARSGRAREVERRLDAAPVRRP